MADSNSVRYYRRLRGLTQKQLADMARVSRSTIEDIEVKQTAPRVYDAMRIALALRVDLYSLFHPDYNI